MNEESFYEPAIRRGDTQYGDGYTEKLFERMNKLDPDFSMMFLYFSSSFLYFSMNFLYVCMFFLHFPMFYKGRTVCFGKPHRQER